MHVPFSIFARQVDPNYRVMKLWKLTQLAAIALVGLGLTNVEARPSSKLDAEAIYDLIGTWPPEWRRPDDREEPSALAERYRTIARAVEQVGEVKGPFPVTRLKLAVLVTWYGESRFGKDVHEGKLSRWGSDTGKAACFGQLHQNRLLDAEAWEAMKGTSLEATTNCAIETAKALQRMARMCAYNGTAASLQSVLRAYGSGEDCVYANANDRSRMRIDERVRRFASAESWVYARR